VAVIGVLEDISLMVNNDDNIYVDEDANEVD